MKTKLSPPPTPPHHRIAAGRIRQALIAYYFTLVLYIVFSFLPEYRVWAFNWWAYYPFWLKLMLVFVGAAAPPIVIKYLGTDSVTDERVSHSTRGFWLIAGTVSAVFVVLFILLRARMHFLGDGYLLLGVLCDQHVMGRAWTAVGDQLHAVVFGLLSGSAEEKALGTFQMFSWLSGLAALVVFAYLARYLTQGTLRRTLVFLSLATGGYALLFFGYVENYPPFIFAVALFLLFALLIVQERLAVYWIILSLVPAFLAHIFAVALIPPTVYLLLHRSPLARWYSSVPPKTRRMMFLLAVIIGLAALIAMYAEVLFIRYALVPIVANEVTTDSYTFFSLAHLLDYVNLLFVLMPGLLVAIFALIGTRLRSSLDLYTRLVLLTAGVSLFMTLIFNPNLGMARDWDVFAFAGLPLVLLFTLLLIEQKQLAALGLCTMLALLVLLPRAGAQVVPEIAIAHFRNYADLNPLMSRTGVYALSRYYYQAGDSANGRAVEEEFLKSYPAYSLERRAKVLMNQGDARSAALLARQAVELDGRLFDAHVVLASAYLQMGDLGNAERSAKIANAVSPNTSMGLHVLGAVQCASGDTERGLKNMYQAREILDSLGQITNDIAQVLIVKGDMAGAMLEIQRLVKDSTVPAGIFAGVAASLQNFGNIDAARTIWKEAEDRGLDSATAAQWLAQFPQLGL